MRYVSDVEFRKQLTELLKELNNTKDDKQKRKIEDEISYLKKLRFESSQEEMLQAMKDRRR